MYIVLSCITLILFCMALKIQIDIKHKYDNGYTNHRKAFILSTTTLIFITLSRGVIVLSNINDLSDFENWQWINFWILTIGLFLVGLFNYMWFSGNNFSFLGKIQIKKYIIILITLIKKK